ncbi:MAG: hypothetical protein KGJ86_00055 [Chloroflexota bacterium]|nr:hypothetical protein [Chloroflexota bacterium]
MPRQFPPIGPKPKPETVTHNGQVVKLRADSNGWEHIVRPDGGFVGPFRPADRELALNIAADYFSFGVAE